MTAVIRSLIGPCALATGLILTSVGWSAVNPDSVVGIWLFDEGTGTVARDTSGNGRDATLNGTFSWIAGRIGSAVELDGSSAYVDAGPITLPANAVTVVFWANITSSDEWRHIVESGFVEYEWTCGFRVEVGNEGIVYIAIGDGDVDDYNDNAGNGVPTGWTYGEWTHFVFVYDGATGVLYQNGEEADRFDSNLDIRSGVGTLIIGGMGGHGRFLDGTVDEVGVYSDPLDASTVRALMDGIGSTTDVAPQEKAVMVWAHLKR